ncbi:MAG: zinc ribbon domain-containing protein [Clostridia bacterium]|nr:zinc ribbon domain-containing protein [Clostridia bacterium]
MYCPKCGAIVSDKQTFCTNCGADVRALLAKTEPAPRRRQSFLNVFSFVFSLIGAWCTFLTLVVPRLLASAGAYAYQGGIWFGNPFFFVAVFFCSVTAILAFASLFGRNRRKGLGIAALVISCLCLLILFIPRWFPVL